MREIEHKGESDKDRIYRDASKEVRDREREYPYCVKSLRCLSLTSQTRFKRSASKSRMSLFRGKCKELNKEFDLMTYSLQTDDKCSPMLHRSSSSQFRETPDFIDMSDFEAVWSSNMNLKSALTEFLMTPKDDFHDDDDDEEIDVVHVTIDESIVNHEDKKITDTTRDLEEQSHLSETKTALTHDDKKNVDPVSSRSNAPGPTKNSGSSLFNRLVSLFVRKELRSCFPSKKESVRKERETILSVEVENLSQDIADYKISSEISFTKQEEQNGSTAAILDNHMTCVRKLPEDEVANKLDASADTDFCKCSAEIEESLFQIEGETEENEFNQDQNFCEKNTFVEQCNYNNAHENNPVSRFESITLVDIFNETQFKCVDKPKSKCVDKHKSKRVDKPKFVSTKQKTNFPRVNEKEEIQIKENSVEIITISDDENVEKVKPVKVRKPRFARYERAPCDKWITAPNKRTKNKTKTNQSEELQENNRKSISSKQYESCDQGIIVENEYLEESNEVRRLREIFDVTVISNKKLNEVKSNKSQRNNMGGSHKIQHEVSNTSENLANETKCRQKELREIITLTDEVVLLPIEKQNNNHKSALGNNCEYVTVAIREKRLADNYLENLPKRICK